MYSIQSHDGTSVLPSRHSLRVSSFIKLFPNRFLSGLPTLSSMWLYHHFTIIYIGRRLFPVMNYELLETKNGILFIFFIYLPSLGPEDILINTCWKNECVCWWGIKYCEMHQKLVSLFISNIFLTLNSGFFPNIFDLDWTANVFLLDTSNYRTITK